MMFYYEMTGSVVEGRAVDVICHNFIKAFDTTYHNILIDKLTKYGLSKWTVRWTEK